ncbi:MAG: cytochrome ubiquinol oxidase subunit I [bacterium]
MDLDAVLLARIQFALTVGFHFLFPPLSIGLAWLLVYVEWKGWKKKDEIFLQAGKFFSKILALTFAVGVATGIVMEFQFGTNWAEYSKFVGDIFGAPLAAEALFAFFLESTFMGLYLFGRNRVSPGVHWFAILMVAVGATISAFWIIVANSWQQTPAGYIIQNGRAELIGFWAAVFNPSTIIRFSHTIMACLVAGAFYMAGISVWLILKKRGEFARKSLKVSIIFGLIFSFLTFLPFGHEHVRQVARTQPEKFATMEGLYVSQSQAPLMLFGIVNATVPRLDAEIKIPGLLSLLLYGTTDAHVQGLDQFIPEEIPPLWMTFVSFHNMVLLGMYFILLMLIGVWFIRKKNLYDKKWYLKLLLFSSPLPLLACEFGWVAAEVGRQPWVVYKVLKTVDAVSMTVSKSEIIFSIVLFSVIYIFLMSLFIFLLLKETSHVPEISERGEAMS